MSQVLKSCLLRAAGASLVLAGLAATPVQASEQIAQPVSGSDSITVVKDKDTGKLRNATAAEHKALMAAKKDKEPRVAPGRALQKFHASGAGGLRLTDEMMSTAVAVRNADGTIGMQCNEAHEHGSHAVQATVPTVTE